MAITYSAKGTSFPTFTVGKKGPTMHQGVDDPTSQGIDGDVYIQTGSTPALWQKVDGDWTKVGSESTKVFFGDTAVDTNEVNDKITLTAGGHRVVEIGNDVAAATAEKLTITPGSATITLATVDSSGTNPVDMIVDLQGSGTLKIQGDGPSQITTPDGTAITVQPGAKTVGMGGNVNINGGNTTAANQIGGNIVLTPGTSGSGGGAAQILTATGYVPVSENSVVNRLGQATFLTVVVSTLATHNVAANEHVILVNRSTSAATSVVLPSTNVAAGRIVRVKDAKGDADVNLITVSVNGGGNIDGSVNKQINTQWGSQAFVYTGTQWVTI